MVDRTSEIHAAIVAALKADSAVTALVSTRIHDAQVQNVTFPWLHVTAELGEFFDGAGLDGWEQLVRVDIWSRKAGQSGEAYTIAAAVNAVLHSKARVLSAGKFINGRMLPGGQRLIRDPDGISVQIQQRYRFVTQD